MFATLQQSSACIAALRVVGGKNNSSVMLKVGRKLMNDAPRKGCLCVQLCNLPQVRAVIQDVYKGEESMKCQKDIFSI